MSKRGKRQGELEPDFIKLGPLEFHPVVFPVSALLILGFTLWGFVSARQDAEGTENIFAVTLDWLATNFGWFYILAANLLLISVGVLIFSRFGRIRLGGADCKPDYRYGSWFAMLFSAGMGIGLMFWSVAEPMYHFGSPPGILATGSPEAAREAMLITFYHWGLHAWGIYALVGCAIAYFAFNRGLPITIRSTFYPILGKRVRGPFGHLIDILAVVATLFGVATSLGLGVLQINSGLHHLFPKAIAANGTTAGTNVQMLLIIGITLAATASVVSGLDRGIKRLSQANLILAGALLLMVFLIGPTAHLLDALLQNIGNYIYRLVPMATWTETYRNGEGGGWQHGWTIFYWGWWISWSPFVGMFIARISRGRTIREFALGVLFVPTLLTFVWLTVFGNSALHEEMAYDSGILSAVNENFSTAIFKLFEHYPLSRITSGLAVIVVITFFVTSSDSGSLVIDTITGGGHPKPPVIQKVFWALLEGGVAAALLYAGGLKALQSAAITTGLPFALALLVMTFCLFKALRRERADPTGKE
ncbi:BCCT family transporter [Haloferula sp. A504]|uniref:BCCT family transporter n=1 Tax=Haloferula sp. A504 TaxID=3373601 RepID=UPI0031C2C845|nr:BCCT family transporter [Verrucomicrobiaceae bacterium E54]